MNALEERAYDKHFVLCCWLVLRNLHSRNLPFISMKCFHFHKLIIAAWPIRFATHHNPYNFLIFSHFLLKIQIITLENSGVGVFQIHMPTHPSKIGQLHSFFIPLESKTPHAYSWSHGGPHPTKNLKILFLFFWQLVYSKLRPSWSRHHISYSLIIL